MPVPGEENLTADADFETLGIKPETFDTVPPATRDAMRGFGQDLVISYLGSQVKRPITAWDSSLRRAAIVMAAKSCMDFRGWRPGGKDGELIIKIIDDVTKWLAELSDPRKDRKPYYVDSTPALDERGPLSSSSATSDAWAKSGGCFRRACRCR